MATSSALLAEWAWTNNRKGMAGCNGGWGLGNALLGQGSAEALDASLGNARRRPIVRATVV